MGDCDAVCFLKICDLNRVTELVQKRIQGVACDQGKLKIIVIRWALWSLVGNGARRPPKMSIMTSTCGNVDPVGPGLAPAGPSLTNG